jgi:TolB-like protein
MGADEEGTLARLKSHRAVVDPIVEKHGGRIVGTAGDGVLMEYPSVVEAVGFAVEAQILMAERNADLADDEKMLFRIGINLGDILADGDDIFGDGVNVAARLETLADPGGICVSRTVRDNVRDRMDVNFDDLGDVEVKNIARPVRVFKVLMADEVAAGRPRRRPFGLSGAAIAWTVAAVLVLAAAVGGLAWWSKPWQSTQEQTATADRPHPLPDKPSIAVLSFDSLSEDPSQQYFADGMAEDLITDLSKISGLFVIARNSSFKYKGRNVDLKKVGRELGVRYVLEGSVRRIGDQVRINVQLIDSTTGGHLWADRYDGAFQDLFALQDRVTENIISALSVKLTADDRVRSSTIVTHDVIAHDAFLKGWAYYVQATPEDYVRAVPYLEDAIKRDPGHIKALAALASIYLSARANGWSRFLDITPDDALEHALDLLDRALDNPVPLVHQVRSRFLLEYRKYDAAIAEADKAIALDANDPAGYLAKSRALILSGSAEEALPVIKSAVRLDPHLQADNLYLLSMAQFGLSRYDQTLDTLERAHRLAPDHPDILALIVATLGYLDRRAETAPYITLLRKFAAMRSYPHWRLRTSVTSTTIYPYKQKRDTEHYRDGLRMGGLPEFDGEWNFDRADRLSGDELRRISFGRTQEGFHAKSKLVFTVTRTPEGAFTSTGLWNDTGVSRIVDYRLCDRSDRFNIETCAIVYRHPDGSTQAENEFILIRRSGTFPFRVK